MTSPKLRADLITTRRYNDPPCESEGYRLLICRYRPRGVRREGEPWDAFCPELGPSIELHAAIYGKQGPPIPWAEYVERYSAEMARQRFLIRGYAESVARGEALVLLCSAACVDAARCHRVLLRQLMLSAL